MIAIDTNILVYAHRRDAPLHARAQACLHELAAGRRRWALPWPCVHEFFAIVTHPRIWRPPTAREQAIAQLEAWLASPSCTLLGESQEHFALLSDHVSCGEVVGPMVHDARIAAICLGHGAELWTTDRDFSRFPSLRLHNPLVRS